MTEMPKPTASRVATALLIGFLLLLAAAWLSGSTAEICKEAKTGQEQCAAYNLALFLLIEIREFLHSIEGVITALATIAVAWFTWTLWRSSEKMWIVTKESADTARSSLIASNRAWIRPAISPAGKFRIDKNGISGSVRVEMTNVGNAPASHINIEVWMAPYIDGQTPWDLLKSKSIRIHRPTVGYSLFPGEVFPKDKGIGGWHVGVQVRRDDCERAAAQGKNQNKIITLYVYGCITYTFASNPVGCHQTRFIYQLGRNPLTSPFQPYISIAEDDEISGEDLWLMEPAVGIGVEAD